MGRPLRRYHSSGSNVDVKAINHAVPYHPIIFVVCEDLQDLLRNFLFSGINELASKTFLDYFPEYSCEGGAINEKRSILGKSFESRPWNSSGEFVGNTSEANI